MNTKLLSALLAIAAATGLAAAQVAVKADANVSVKVGTGSSSASGTAQGGANASVRGNATSSANKSDKASSTATSSVRSRASSTGEEHMSIVARFVQSLLAIADREGGIGAQVRMIAKAQNDTATTSASAIATLESRSKLRTFLFGTDYTSVGQLRSAMSVTEANLESLQKLLGRTADVNDKTELEAQIKALQDSQVKLDAFVKAHESAFSLFGWLRAR